MKPATVALLILLNMMCIVAYFDHGTMAEETTLLANSYGRNEGTKGIHHGRKLMDNSIGSNREYSIDDMSHPKAPHTELKQPSYLAPGCSSNPLKQPSYLAPGCIP
ncbi:uncharacterized protein LOC100275145 precursor [Zea mays]|jgi:hypothetical protein|uniref:Uncharacterized protein n=1 Tax=Zea mays TaxID=4577 RepID=B6SP09_MAIZE|nr:uncharacterized protein LOC100275145 precursor [Zea mays]ACG26592.1 hypothetical protein [Zea mays]|eukprot:NP_001142783.1 uncharacterized protein LOC100275145 precursor [Zea mays]